MVKSNLCATLNRFHLSKCKRQSVVNFGYYFENKEEDRFKRKTKYVKAKLKFNRIG